MSSPLVSVVIPAYNHEQYVGDAIASVLAQSVRDIEIIVIDDGSTDKTPDILQGMRDPRINCLRQENQGAHNTINRGVSMARAPWIAILNSDDVFDPEKLERHLRAHHNNKDLVATASRVQYVSKSGHPLARGDLRVCNYENKRKRANVKMSLFESLLQDNHLITTSALFASRDVLRQLGGFIPLRYTHDWFMFLSLASRGGLMILEEPLVSYRMHSSNTIKENLLRVRCETHFVIEWQISDAVSRALPLFDAVKALDILNENVFVDFELITFFQLWRMLNHGDLKKASAIFQHRDHPVLDYAEEILKGATPGYKSRRRLEDVLQSKSWKITAPLRRFHEFLMRFR